MDEYELNKKIDERAKQMIKSYFGNNGFIEKKVTASPTDALSVVNRKYVTNNGTSRPTSSVVGQLFLDTSLAAGNGKPIWWNGTGWVDATGTYV